MSQEDHKLIDECKSKAQELMASIEKYKASAELNQAATESLKSVARAIERVASELAPLMSYPVKRYSIILGTVCLLNSVALIAILVLQLVK